MFQFDCYGWFRFDIEDIIYNQYDGFILVIGMVVGLDVV